MTNKNNKFPSLKASAVAWLKKKGINYNVKDFCVNCGDCDTYDSHGNTSDENDSDSDWNDLESSISITARTPINDIKKNSYFGPEKGLNSLPKIELTPLPDVYNTSFVKNNPKVTLQPEHVANDIPKIKQTIPEKLNVAFSKLITNCTSNNDIKSISNTNINKSTTVDNSTSTEDLISNCWSYDYIWDKITMDYFDDTYPAITRTQYYTHRIIKPKIYVSVIDLSGPTDECPKPHDKLTTTKLSDFNFQCVKEIDISHNKLSYIPNVCTTIEIYRAKDNQISHIGDHLYNLKNLKILDLSVNQLRSFPDKLNELPSLQELYLANNILSVIHSNIVKVQTLKILDLSNNSIDKIPIDFKNLVNLQVLRLDNNLFTEISPQITSIEKLKILSMNKNKITSIPETIGNLSSLTELRLAGNNIKSISISIILLTKLKAWELPHVSQNEIDPIVNDFFIDQQEIIDSFNEKREKKLQMQKDRIARKEERILARYAIPRVQEVTEVN